MNLSGPPGADTDVRTSAADPEPVSETADSRKPWQRRLARVGELLRGPFASVLLHIAIIALIVSQCVDSGPQAQSSFEIHLMDASVDQLTLDKLDIEPPDELKEEEIPDLAMPEPGAYVGAAAETEATAAGGGPEALDIPQGVVVIDDNASPLELVGAKSAAAFLGNSASSLQLQRKAKTAFGFDTNIKGDLVGTMYDLKRDAAGQARASDYYKDLRSMVQERFAKKAMKSYYRVPKQLFLTHLFLPYVKAETGPEAFGVGGLMEPTKWIIHYTGAIQAPLAGRYRFVGDFDDVVAVFVDGEPVLESTWGDHVTSWKPKDNVGAHTCYTTHPLAYGDWVELRPLNPRRIDIIVGENPGGYVGGLLMVQEEGRDYAKDAKGRPILPIFTVQPLTPDDLQAMKAVPGWTFAEHTPVMGVRQDRLASKAADTNDVKILIE